MLSKRISRYVGVACVITQLCLFSGLISVQAQEKEQQYQSETTTSEVAKVVNSGYKKIDSHYWDDKSHTDMQIYRSGRGVSSIAIVIMAIGLGILVVITKEPNPRGMKTILHMTERDKRMLNQKGLKAGKRVLVSVDRANVIAFLYGLYENKHELILPTFNSLLDKGIYKSVQDIEDGEVYFVRKYPYAELSDSERSLMDILEGNEKYLDIENVLEMRKQQLQEWEDNYIDTEMAKMAKEDFCTTPKLLQRLIHKVKVYNSYDKMRATLQDLKRLSLYFNQYDVSACEESTRVDDMPKFLLLGILISSLTGVERAKESTQKRVLELSVLKEQLNGENNQS